MSDALNVTVYTQPSGPSYKAGTEYSVICFASNGHDSLYTYEWSRGCSYTNQFTSYSSGYYIIGYYETTPVKCQDVYRCRVSNSYTTAVGEITIESVTGTDNNYGAMITIIIITLVNFVSGIAIQILLSPNSVYTTSNISILTVNASGQFIDIICNTGLKKPNVGKWIHPNGTDITFINEKFEIQKGGGIVSLPYTTLGLKDGYSLNSQDVGLYTCKMPDIDMVEQESHIWILQEQDYGQFSKLLNFIRNDFAFLMFYISCCFS